MNPVRTILSVLLALAWLVPARGEILSTWDFGPEPKTFGDEAAAADISNRVEVLSFFHPADDASVGILYRRGTSPKVEAALVGGEDFLARFAVARVPRGGGGYAISGIDASTNAVYDGETFFGKGAGDVFGRWRKEGDNPLPAKMDYAPLEDGDRGFRIQARSDGGESVVGRDFAAPLENGIFEVTAWQEFPASFCGFALYGEDGGEIFRWGVDFHEDSELGVGFVYRRQGDSLYTLISEGGPASYVDYRISWEQADGGLDLTLAAWDALDNTGNLDPWEQYGTPYAWDLGVIHIAGATSVSAMGAIVSGTTASGQGNTMVFDYVKVAGNPSAVPEPATGAMLLLGGAVLALRRRLHRKNRAE